MTAQFNYDFDSNKIMSHILENAKTLANELNKRRNINYKIQAKLDLMRHIKKGLSDSQIDGFRKFISISTRQDKKLETYLYKIKIDEHISSNLANEELYKKLNEISSCQNEALSCLTEVNSEGDSFYNSLGL